MGADNVPIAVSNQSRTRSYKVGLNARGLGACRVSGGASWDTASLARMLVVAKVLCAHRGAGAAVLRERLLPRRSTLLAVDIFVSGKTPNTVYGFLFVTVSSIAA